MSSRTLRSIVPLVRRDFNHAVDRRKEPRSEAADEIYFRDTNTGFSAKEWVAEKLYDKN